LPKNYKHDANASLPQSNSWGKLDFRMITDDIYVVNHLPKRKQVNLIVLDITKRKSLEYRDLLRAIEDREEFKDHEIIITFCCYSPNRKQTIGNKVIAPEQPSREDHEQVQGHFPLTVRHPSEVSTFEESLSRSHLYLGDKNHP
jgi:hypothetical protein